MARRPVLSSVAPDYLAHLRFGHDCVCGRGARDQQQACNHRNSHWARASNLDAAAIMISCMA